IISFVQHYEKEYYQYDYERLHFCKPVFHYILHVAHCLRQLGPQYVYAQWVVERACGTISRGVKSFVKVSEKVRA
ncbi:hypothetical protein BJ508DRAFT_212428, partial [Ascobolus immersus RN42]